MTEQTNQLAKLEFNHSRIRVQVPASQRIIRGGSDPIPGSRRVSTSVWSAQAPQTETNSKTGRCSRSHQGHAIRRTDKWQLGTSTATGKRVSVTRLVTEKKLSGFVKQFEQYTLYMYEEVALSCSLALKAEKIRSYGKGYEHTIMSRTSPRFVWQKCGRACRNRVELPAWRLRYGARCAMMDARCQRGDSLSGYWQYSIYRSLMALYERATALLAGDFVVMMSRVVLCHGSWQTRALHRATGKCVVCV